MKGTFPDSGFKFSFKLVFVFFNAVNINAGLTLQ